MGLGFILIPLTLMFSTSAWPILVAYCIAGAAWEPFAVWWTSALQRGSPADKLARVSSVDWMASFGLMPLGLAMTGPIVALVGERTVLTGTILVLVLITVVVLRVPGAKDLATPGSGLRPGPGSEKKNFRNS